jgi:crossover junction endodeoxyribonuclease RuvC
LPPDNSRIDELTARARRVLGARAPGAREAPPEPLVPERPEPSEPSEPSEPPTEPPPAPSQGGVVFLGVDPGTATTGYGFVRASSPDGGYEPVAFGVVETEAGAPMPLRLQTLYRDLTRLLAAHRPAEAAVEKLFFGRNTTTAISVGQARGVVLLALAEAGVPVAEYTPAEVKQALAGFGRAQKTQVQRMIQALLDLPAPPQPDDAADALAIAICHLRLSRLRAAGLR